MFLSVELRLMDKIYIDSRERERVMHTHNTRATVMIYKNIFFLYNGDGLNPGSHT
jgi:hypothetical protein